MRNLHSKTRWTKTYYMTHGGDCRKLIADQEDNINEPPYNLENVMVCSRDGAHHLHYRDEDKKPKVTYSLRTL